MAYNFYRCDAEQGFLLPPFVRDWLPAGDFFWFVIDAVGEFDLSKFFKKYRDDGVGHAAFDPKMMVTLLIYSYSVGERSSRKIESLCERDIAFRSISGNLRPDHSSICRFRKDFEEEIAGLFLEVLRLCQEAKLTKAGVVALDGTKIQGNASLAANRTKESLEKEVLEILKEAKERDETEDRAHGDKRGDELPHGLQERNSRLNRIRECIERLREKEVAKEEKLQKAQAERQAKEDQGQKVRGRKPKVAAETKKPKANPTDPESRILKSGGKFLQGYNAQAVANEEQVILAAEITQEENDQKQLHAMLESTSCNLTEIGQDGKIGIALADKGYSPEISNPNPVPGNAEIIVPPQAKDSQKDSPCPRGPIPGGATPVERMHRKLKTQRGKALYKKRAQIIEPVFGQIKWCRRLSRFSRRGKKACASEWKLMCAVHNLGKLWKKGWKSAKGAMGNE